MPSKLCDSPVLRVIPAVLRDIAQFAEDEAPREWDQIKHLISGIC